MQEINSLPRTPTEMLSPDHLPGLGCYQQVPNKEEEGWIHSTWMLVSAAARTPSHQDAALLPCVASAELTEKGSDSLNSQKKHNLDHEDSPG